MVEVERFKPGLIHLFYEPRIIGNDHVLLGNERQGAVRQTQEMELGPLCGIHTWNGQLVNLDKSFVKLLQTLGPSWLRKIVREVAHFRKYMRCGDCRLEFIS